ncbi:MAG TPA: hypothetical protein VL337_03955, partial [Acidimicrobiales bacterium]|nr:hypothetical protein [Acidimicrobiales bacterium]
MRTLRQAPKAVGWTETGDPIFEARSERLILRENATHFDRLVACSNCGREVMGSPVLSPADLDHPPQPVVCTDCVRRATAPRDASASVQAAEPSPPEPEPEAEAEPAPGPVAQPISVATAPAAGGNGQGYSGVQLPEVEARLEALEKRLPVAPDGSEPDLEASLGGRIDQACAETAALAAAVASLTQAQAESDRVRQVMAERLGRLSGVHERVAALEARADYAQPLAALAERVDRLAAKRAEDEQRARAEADRLSQEQADLRSEIAAVAAQTPRLEERIDRLAAQQREDEQRATTAAGRLEQGQVNLGRQVNDVARRLAALAAEQPAAVEALADRLERLEGNVEAETVRTRGEAAALGRAVEELARLESQVNERLDRRAERAARAGEADRQRLVALEEHVANSLQGQRTTMEAGLGDALAAIRGEVADVGGAVDRKLGNIERRGEVTEAGLAELAELQASLDAGLGTLRAEIAEVRQAASELAE